MKPVIYVTLLSVFAMSFQTLTAHGKVDADPEIVVKKPSELSFHVTPAQDTFTQGENIDLRFMFRNNGDSPERICTIFKQRKDLFHFFFGLRGNVDKKVFWGSGGGNLTLPGNYNYNYLELRSQEFFSFIYCVNDTIREYDDKRRERQSKISVQESGPINIFALRNDDNLTVQTDVGTVKQGDIITGKHVITAKYYNDHGKNCFRGVLKEVEPVVFEIVERGKAPVQPAAKKPDGLEFSAVLTKTTFEPNEDILVDFTFTNTSKQNVTILAEFEPFDAYFSVSGHNQKGEKWGNVSATARLPRVPRYVTLEPQETFGFRKKLNDLMDGQDAQEGRHKVEIKYANRFGNEGFLADLLGSGGFKGELSSPVVEFMITKEVPKAEPPEPSPSGQGETQADGLVSEETISKPKGDNTEPRVIIEDETSVITVRGPRETFRIPVDKLRVPVKPLVPLPKEPSHQQEN